jgi:hypothetical protein
MDCFLKANDLNISSKSLIVEVKVKLRFQTILYNHPDESYHHIRNQCFILCHNSR